MRSLLDGPAPVTLILIGINVAVSLVGFWALRKKRYRSHFLFISSEAAKGKNWTGTLLSHFAHGDVGHLFVNMLALYLFGPDVEAALGPVFFAIVYVVSGALATLTVFLLRRKNPKHAALGASGCVAGIVFAGVVVAPTASIMLLFFPVPIPAPVFAVLYLVLSSVMMGRGDHIAHEAHIGGSIGGLVMTGLLYEHGFGPLIRAVRDLIG